MLWFKQNKLPLLLLIILSLPAIFSLLRPGFFVSDDGEWMIIRFSAFHQALADGQFPVRWLGRLNHEYGYPVANFLYPGFMYLAEIPRVLGFGFVDSIKIVLGLSMILSGVFAYLWLNKIFRKWPSLIGALVYLYTPYHLFDLYKRGSVGEVLALAVVPFILWTLEKKNMVLASLGTGLLILSHNTLAFLFLPLIFIYTLLKKLFTIYYLLFTIFLGLGLSAFFWIPAIFDLQYTSFFETQVSKWQDYFTDFGLIGLSTVIVFILACIIYFDYSNNRTSNNNKIVALFLIIGFISIFLSLPISAGLWNILPVSFIQFPFRFLSVTIVCAAFLTACIISFSPRKLQAALGIILILLTIISAKQFMTPQQYFNKDEGFYTTNVDSTTVKNEYMPRWVAIVPSERPAQKVEIVGEVGKVDNMIAKNNELRFMVNMATQGTVRVNVIYFPGWEAFVDGVKTGISYENERGVMEIHVLNGEHTVRFSFGETLIRLTSDIIALGSLGLLVLIVFKKR